MKNDLYGKALLDYQHNGFSENIKTHSSLGGEDEYPLPYLFRNFNEMPVLEQKALKLAKGKIIDVGCGAGSHSLYLQQKNKDVLSIDISKGAIETCKLRGIKNAQVQDIWEIKNQQFDSILLLMNGAGMCGKLHRLTDFLNHLKTLLHPNGQILLDSTDVIYMFEDEEGNYLIDANQPYYGETIFTMEYKNKKGVPFNWLYVDYINLQRAANFCGLHCELIQKGEYFDYLARITLK